MKQGKGWSGAGRKEDTFIDDMAFEQELKNAG